MHAGPPRVRRLATATLFSSSTICTSCLHHLSSSSRALSTATNTTPPLSTSPPPPSATARKAFRILCSPVVSRPPLLTRNLNAFEKAFYLYQKRLNERLALPFTRYFYYKKGTPADVEWKRKAKGRKTAARDIGVYNAYADDGWNDEVLVGSKLQEPEDVVTKLVRDAEGKGLVEEENAETAAAQAEELAKSGVRMAAETVVEKPMPRQTTADQDGDFRSLDRMLDRSVYLLVKGQDGEWRFPVDRVHGRENLHQAAERVLLQAGGINMNTWVVGNHPVGHFMKMFSTAIMQKIAPNRLVSTSAEELEQLEYGEKVFFMKARIMAGQADMSKNELGDQDFQWLAKEEIQSRVKPDYWHAIRSMLTER